MIGTKTLAVLAFAVAVVGAAVALGTFAPERLATRGFGSIVFVAAFGVVVGTAAFHFGRFGDKSGHYLRQSTEPSMWDASEGHFVGGERWRIVIGENREGEAFDLSPRARHAASVVLASVLALAATDSRALEQLGHTSEGVTSLASTYCPEEEEEKPAAQDANEPGCELVRRAYALGYAKSLGTCAPKKAERAGEARPICTRRQRDEPLLHYSWRLLADHWTKLRSSAGAGVVARAKDDFRARAGHLRSLGETEAEILTSAPHASHHVWTTLPDPKDGAFEGTTCTARYARLPHRPALAVQDSLRASKVFEQVYAQLLFEGTYDTAAGHCREYHVHWGAPADACARLAASPEAFLAAEHALDDVRATLERHRVAGDLVAIGGAKPSADVASFVSFGCYVEGPAPAGRTDAKFSLAGHPFVAGEVRVAPSPPDALLYVDRYDAVARLLADGFHYGSFLSEAGIDRGSAGGLDASFAESDFRLTRLYELESVDLYLDSAWVAKHPDLLDVYPYERHLKNYVQVFRRQYRRQRGRL